jgi:DNA-binding NarL/FixJ family response regulator
MGARKGSELRAGLANPSGDVAVLRVRFAPFSLDELALPRAVREVAELVVAGLSNREIAERRGVSVRTAENQVAALYRHTNTRSRGELIAFLKR